jgi:hypothetical protein
VRLAGSWRGRRKRGSLRTGRAKPKGRAATTRRAGTSCSGLLIAVIHPSAWKGPSANFACSRFSDFVFGRTPPARGRTTDVGTTLLLVRPVLAPIFVVVGAATTIPTLGETLIHRGAWKRDSPKSVCRMLHLAGPTGPEIPASTLSTRPTAAGTCAMDTRLPEFRPGAQTASPADRQGFLCTIHREVPI